LNTFL